MDFFGLDLDLIWTAVSFVYSETLFPVTGVAQIIGCLSVITPAGEPPNGFELDVPGLSCPDTRSRPKPPIAEAIKQQFVTGTGAPTPLLKSGLGSVWVSSVPYM